MTIMRQPRPTALLGLVIVALLGTASPGRAQDKEAYEKVVTIEGITEYRSAQRPAFPVLPRSLRVHRHRQHDRPGRLAPRGLRRDRHGPPARAHALQGHARNFPNIDKACRTTAPHFNATTWVDRTNYYETMPATDKNLEFGIQLEADRLVNSFIRREDLAKEMTVVRNEFEMGENNPERILSQRMMAVAYEWHNYGKSTIGNRSDIERVPIENLQAFYHKYYQPDNVVLIVAGKFDEDKALEYVSQVFRRAQKAGPSAARRRPTPRSPPRTASAASCCAASARWRSWASMYHIPAAAHAGLRRRRGPGQRSSASDPSGRLYKALVETKKATSVSGGSDGLARSGRPGDHRAWSPTASSRKRSATS